MLPDEKYSFYFQSKKNFYTSEVFQTALLLQKTQVCKASPSTIKNLSHF
jgi:hypothetical protein